MKNCFQFLVLEIIHLLNELQHAQPPEFPRKITQELISNNEVWLVVAIGSQQYSVKVKQLRLD